ncbi:MAG: ATP-binding protein [Thermoanaerobaculia bacterium]
MISRHGHLRRLKSLRRQFPVVAILGARQVGKTTLARRLVAGHGERVTIFDLEDAGDLALLADPLLALGPLKGLIVIDEVQRRPELFAALRVLVDQPRSGRRFLVLGSASPDLLRQTSESLAGRIAYYELGGFSLDEVGSSQWARLWRRGGFPKSFLARSEGQSLRWRRELIRTYLERDIPALGLRLPAPTLRRFWMMVAHYHGQLWNSSELARSLATAHTTVQRYLDILTETFMVRQLPSWHENLGKRQVKAPKLYVRDSGLLHALLGVGTERALETHPKVGASWEGFALDAVVARLGARPEECFFWATHSGAELDLLVIRGTRRLGFEFKRTTAPSLTRSMHVALADLQLKELVVVHAGVHSFPMAGKVRAIALRRILEDLKPLP